MAKAEELKAEDFETAVLKSEKLVLVDFWASWCGPCQMMAPILDELAEDNDLRDKIKIAKLNIETKEGREIALRYRVMSIPNMKVFKEGKVVKEIVGARSKEEIKRELLEASKQVNK